MVPDLAGVVPGNAGISSSSHSLYYVVGMDTLCRVLPVLYGVLKIVSPKQNI